MLGKVYEASLKKISGYESVIFQHAQQLRYLQVLHACLFRYFLGRYSAFTAYGQENHAHLRYSVVSKCPSLEPSELFCVRILF